MEPIPPSGFFLSNRLARQIYVALIDVLGEDGLHVILNHAGLPQRAGDTPNDEAIKGVDFSEISSLFRSLEDVYGERGSRGMALRAGKAIWKNYLSASLDGSAGDESHLSMRLLNVLQSLAASLNQESDMDVAAEVYDGGWQVTVQRCPLRWGREDSQPVCHLTAGILEAAASDFLPDNMNVRLSESTSETGGQIFAITFTPALEDAGSESSV